MAEGCGNVVNPEGFPSFPCPGAEGERGRWLSSCSFAPPLPFYFFFAIFLKVGGVFMADIFETFSLQQLRALYQEKNAHLSRFLSPVSPYDFYRAVFPVGSFERKGSFSDRKGNGIALRFESSGQVLRFTLTDELDALREIMGCPFAIISPISYFGKSRSGRNARYLYALAFDLDGVGMPQLRDTLHQMNKGVLPKATFVVNSGTGLHLYYVLGTPVPMYPQNQKWLRELKYSLTKQIWNRFTSTIKEPQMQSVLQGFRAVGSGSKLGQDYPVVAFRLGDSIELESLLPFIPDSNGEQQYVMGLMQKKSMLTLAEAKEKYPDWYERRIVQGERRSRWTVKRDLYDWWFHRISDEIKVGHRYYGIMTLAIYAKKCGISEEELRRDAFSLLKPYDEMSEEETNRFTEDDIVCALEMFNEDYVTFPRDDIGRLSGLTMPINKRNGRKQVQHLMLARGQLAILKQLGEVSTGRPWGSGTKKDQVVTWRNSHPDGTKAECRRDTGLDPKTIRKWWDSVAEESLTKEKNSLSQSS